MSIKFIGEMWNSPKEKVNCVIQPGLLPTGGLMVITGEPGVGKSFLCQETAFEIACGRRWLGLFPTVKSRTIYLELEKRSPIARERFSEPAWKKKYPEAAGNLGYFDEEIPQVDTDSGMNKIAKMVQQINAKVVIVDSLSVTVWDETDTVRVKKAIGNYRQLAKDLNISFIFIQHLIKRPSAYDYKKSSWVEKPIRINDLKGSKYVQYEADTIVGMEARGNTKTINFLKHSFCRYPLQEQTPLSFYFNPDSGKPFTPINKKYEILDMVDMGIVTFTEIMSYTGISKHTLLNAVDELSKYGIVDKVEGSGRKSSIIIPKHTEKII